MKRAALSLVLALACATTALAADQRTLPVLAAPAPVWPTPVVRTLDNGLVVAVFPQHRLPIVQVQLALPAGTAAEDTSQLGAAALTASLLRAGTTSRTSEQFQRDLDQLGGVFAANVTRDQALVSAGFLASDLENGMEIFSDAVVNPIFPEEEFDVARRSAARQLGAARTQMALAADERAWAAAWASYAYGRPPAGTVGNLVRLRREALQSFHGEHWRPDRAVLVIAGDVAPERAFAVAEEWFRRWSGRSPEPPRAPAPVPVSDRVQVLDLPGATQVEVRLVRPTPGRASVSGTSWALFAQTLAAGGTLPANVRAAWSGVQDAGVFMLASGGPADSAGAIVRRLQRAWAAAASSPSSGEAIGRSLDEQVHTAPLAVETLGGLASAWQAGRLAGLGDDHLAGTPGRLAKAAEPAAIAGVVAALKQPGAVLVVGPAAKLRESLVGLGPLDVQPFDEIAAPRDTVPEATAEQRARGRQVLDATLRAHGGASRLGAIRGLYVAGEMTVQMGDRAVQGEFEQLREEPFRFSYVTRLLDFPTRQVLAGDRGWAVSGTDEKEVLEADSAGVQSLRTVFESDLLHLLLRADEPEARAAWVGTEIVAGRAADLLEFRSRAGARMRFVVDGTSKRVVAVDAAPSPDGVWHERRVFSDLRLVEGVWLPFKEERRVDGTPINSFRARTVTVNPTVNEEMFRHPSDRR